MIKCFSIICLMLTTFTLSACDYGLAFFGNKTFTVRFHTPPGLKMYVGTGWSSDSFLCREISFGSSSGFTRGGYSKVVDAEENDGEWLAEVPIELWHPFCSWRHEALAIGFSDENSIGKEGNTLAFAYLEPNSPENPTEGNAVSLVCDKNTTSSIRFQDRVEVESAILYYLECKERGSEKNVASTINIAFLEGRIGDFNLEYSGRTENLRNTRVKENTKPDENIRIHKTTRSYLNKIEEIRASMSIHNEHWELKLLPNAKYKILYYTAYEAPPILEKEMYLSDEQLQILASEEQFELPDFVK